MGFEQQTLWSFIGNTLPEFRDLLKRRDTSELDQNEKAILDFLLTLSGETDGLEKTEDSDDFLSAAAGRIRDEWDYIKQHNGPLYERAESLVSQCGGESPAYRQNALLNFLFPEKNFAGGDFKNQQEEIRKRRTVDITELNQNPIQDPAGEILFSSNVLLTVPPENYYSKLTPSMQERARAVASEDQQFWFDHPILMGVETDANEMIYGLRGLADTLKYEKENGHAASDAQMTVILSLSVTHNGLKNLAHEYLAKELENAGSLEGLKVYLFTEEDTKFLASHLSCLSDVPESQEAISAVFGVDGCYGRHYSFLKALAPLWTICMDPKVKGTFKIDLDQVFPQKELTKQTGKSAFQHFMTPLWGAGGVDSRGRDVTLGMIAGALVNEKDIHKGIYTADIPLPDENAPLKGETRVFDKLKVMSASTRGEMMTRYNSAQFPEHPDGKSRCISRVHVTGGTNGILCETLRQYRPFTPGFIGRAEDQAYILSVLLGNPSGDQEGPLLRYVHESGLIMRHDKEAFAGDAIAAAKLGTWIGDLLRLLYFSFYARFIPGSVEAVKEELDPFTGCFITPFPYTMVFLRLILKVLDEPQNREVLLDLASRRLGSFVTGEENGETVKAEWMAEREGWDLFYDSLDLLESEIEEGTDRAKELTESIRERLENCRIC
ncbi:MAG: hypothetical protein B6241_09725 [Spirochaetaceae bacterium 4572_59]|nr:MAG: hypothetical protein B6241_09725 [Spirochaetaceae bacterium 4572_59]